MYKVHPVRIMQAVTDKQEPITLKIKTINSERHVSFVTNRIWGGLQLNGLFELNFILEHSSLPDSLTIQIENGAEKELSRSNENELIRENQATAYMNIETLLALHNWLNLKVQELQARNIIGSNE
jgi:hypothetical protein